MPSKLILDPNEPGVNEVIAGMALNQPITLREVTIVPTLIDQATVEADVTAIEVEGMEAEGAGGEPIAEGEPGGPKPAEETLSKMPRENEGGFDEGAF